MLDFVCIRVYIYIYIYTYINIHLYVSRDVASNLQGLFSEIRIDLSTKVFEH